MVIITHYQTQLKTNMKKKIPFIFLYGFILFFLSCSRINENTKETIKISLEDDSCLLFSSLFSKVDYIPFETNNSSHIGTIERFRIFGDKVAIICNKSLLLFDIETGRHLLTIAQQGNGSNNYVTLYDVFIEQNHIEILDCNGKILFYDLKGNFIKAVSIPLNAFAFTKTTPDDYWFKNNMYSDGIEETIIHYNIAENLIKERYLPVNKKLASYFYILENNNFNYYKDGLLFFSSPIGEIYYINNKNNLETAYTIDFGSHNVPKEFYNGSFNNIREFVTEAEKHDYVFAPHSFASNNQNILLSYLYKKRSYWTFYNIGGKNVVTGNSLQDDIHSLNEYPIKGINTHYVFTSNYMFFVISAEQFINMSSKNKLFQKEIEKKSITEQSNPILVKCELKKLY